MKTTNLNKMNGVKMSINSEVKNTEVAISATEKIVYPISMEAEGFKLEMNLNYECSVTVASSVLAQQELSKISREEAKFKKDLFMETLGELSQVIMTAYPIIRKEIQSIKEDNSKKSQEYRIESEFESWKRGLEIYLEVEDEIKSEKPDEYNESIFVSDAKRWASAQKKLYLMGMIEDKRIENALRSLGII